MRRISISPTRSPSRSGSSSASLHRTRAARSRSSSARRTKNTWEQCINGNGSLYFFSSATTSTVDDDTLIVQVPVSVGVWHHLAITWDAGPRRKELWLDGGRIGVSAGIAHTPLFDSGAILLGIDIDSGSASAAFPGTLDDFRIYNRALTPDELQSLANP